MGRNALKMESSLFRSEGFFIFGGLGTLYHKGIHFVLNYNNAYY